MRDRDERRKEFDCALVNALSRHSHELDVKNNAEPVFRRPRKASQHPNSAKFAEKWGTK
jgi:hypothetical protein